MAGAGLGAAQELLVARGAEAAARLRDPVELRLHFLEPPGLGLEGRQEAPERRGDVLQALLDVAEVHVLVLELRREVRHGHESVRRPPEPVERSGLVLLGRERLGRLPRRLGKLGHMA